MNENETNSAPIAWKPILKYPKISTKYSKVLFHYVQCGVGFYAVIAHAHTTEHTFHDSRSLDRNNWCAVLFGMAKIFKRRSTPYTIYIYMKKKTKNSKN